MTPHDIHIVSADGIIIHTFPKSGNTIRLAVTTVRCADIDGIPTSTTQFGEPVGLPDFSEGTFFLVSQLVKSALPNRTDLLVPAEMMRDNNGNIIGCQSLGR